MVVGTRPGGHLVAARLYSSPGRRRHRKQNLGYSGSEAKAHLLAREYEAFQTAVYGGDADLHSATDQQASKVQRQKDPNPDTEQPVVLRNDVFDVVHDGETVLSSWWVKVPVYDPERGRGNSIRCRSHVPRKDEQLVCEGDVRDSELVRRNGDWYVHLVVDRSVTVQDAYDDVLAIDMGARWVATCAFLSDRKTTFYREEVRRIRDHYKQLRKSIGKANPRQGQQVVERVGDAEARKWTTASTRLLAQSWRMPKNGTPL